jgi:hypothetical protein
MRNFLPKTQQQLQADANAAIAAQVATRARQEKERSEAAKAPPPPDTGATSGDFYANRERVRQTVMGNGGRRKSRKLGNKFNRCVKSVRSTVKARKGSNKESAAIAICTTSVLQTRGRTMKRYRKGRLTTQRKFRGGCS